MADFIAKNAYFDSIKGIKIQLTYNYEIWQLAYTSSIYWFRKKIENYTFVIKS